MSNKIENITKFTAQIMFKKWQNRAETIEWLERNYSEIGYDETANELSLLMPFVRNIMSDLSIIIEAENNND